MAKQLNNIKLLHKRYTFEQWKSGGVTIGRAEDGSAITGIPTLAFGEFGFAYAEGKNPEVRANTWSQNPISFAEATVVSFPGLSTVHVNDLSGKSPSGKYIESYSYNITDQGATLQFTEADLPSLTIAKKSTSSTGSFITGIEVDSTDPHKLLYTLGEHPVSSLTVTAGTNTASPTTDTVKVAQAISGSSSTHAHAITYTTVEVPTKKYIDNQVKAVAVEVQETGTGNYVQNVSAENKDGKHLITVTKATLPTIPSITVGNASTTTASDANILAEISASNHTITPKTKQIKGSGTISVTPSAGAITIGIDDSNYATKDEVSQAMIFKGTLGDTASGATNTSLNAASKAQVGDTYKVVKTGQYTINGKTENLTLGDMVICRQIGTSNSYEWIIIPSGDDVNSFIQELKEGPGIDISGTKVETTISHHAYGPGANSTTYNGGFTDNTSNGKTYGVKGTVLTDLQLDTDNLGHVASATLSNELNIVSESGARLIVAEEEHVTTLAATGTAITVSQSGTDKARTYTVNHANVDCSTPGATARTPGHGGEITVISGVTVNSQGHVTKVEKDKITLPADNNSWRPVYVNDEESPYLTATGGTNLRLKGASNITVEKSNESDGTITIKTLGAATGSALGFVQLGTSTGISESNRSYPVGFKTNTNQLYVNVPWENTDVYGHTLGLSDDDWRFAVFKRDRGGHLIEVDDIAAIDANY